MRTQGLKSRIRAAFMGIAVFGGMAGMAANPAFANVQEPFGSNSDAEVMKVSGLTAEELKYYADRDKNFMDKAVKDNLLASRIGSTSTRGTVYSPKSGEPGEIWVSTFGNSSGSSSIVGHAAIVSNNKSVTIESFAKNYSPIGLDGVQRYSNSWRSRPGGKILLGNRVSSPQKRQAAASWASSQVGKPYNWNFFNKWDTNSYYCSQLVWRAWLTQGNNIDYVTIDSIVTPAELVNSSATVTLWATNG